MVHKRRAKRSKRRNRIRISHNDIARIKAPNIRLKSAFDLMDEVFGTANTARFAKHVATPFEQFQSGIFQRASNSLAAINVLLQHGHWEGAVGIARQLLELSLSLEYIFDDLSEAQQRALRFVNFGMLQTARYIQIRDAFERRQGRPGNPELAASVSDEILATEYATFHNGTRNDGSIRWADTWSGKTVRALAYESALPARVDQYELFYRVWSEQVHGAPSALLTSIFPLDGSGWIETVLHEDDKMILEALGNSVAIFCEIWQGLPLYESSLELDQAKHWLRTLRYHQPPGFP